MNTAHVLKGNYRYVLECGIVLTIKYVEITFDHFCLH